MNMKLYKSILLAAVIMLPLTSCLKEQADVFEVPSSQRMQDYLESVRTILTDSNNEFGWVLSYYPGSSYATCYFGLQFSAQTVTAYGQKDPSMSEETTYKLTTDDGAVLSFDSYNTVLHYYATASSDHYTARGGDFEFEIKEVSANRIVLRGKRSGNFCYLDKLTKEASEFLTEMNAAKKALNIVSFSGEVTGGLVEGFLDGTSSTLSIGRKGAATSELTKVRYMVTSFGEGEGKKSGIHINEPISFQGVTFQDFIYEEDPTNPTIGTFTGSGITFDKVVPEGFVPYDQFVGKWTMDWYQDHRTFTVELVPFEEGASFKMKGLSTYFEPIIGYNAARGQLSWNAQAVGSSGATTVMLAAWDLAGGGNLAWDESLGMVGYAEDNTVTKLVVIWEDNGEGSGFNTDSWILWGADANGNSTGQFEGWTFANGYNQLPYVNSMTKVVE